jgi:hypothetical protein
MIRMDAKRDTTTVALVPAEKVSGIDLNAKSIVVITGR